MIPLLKDFMKELCFENEGFLIEKTTAAASEK